MKKVLVIVYMIDIILIALFSYILVWWKDNHNMPGLAEMLNIKLHIAYMVIAIVVFVVLTILLMKSSAYPSYFG